MRHAFVLWVAFAVSCGSASVPRTPAPTAGTTTMRVAALPIPGPPALVSVARDIVDVTVALDPSYAASAGLFEDAIRVPDYRPAAVALQTARLDHDLAALRALPWRSYPIDAQIDHRWLYSLAETARHALVNERLFEHRAAQWLEPLSNDLIALLSYAPERADLRRRLFVQIPDMLAQMRAVVTRPTRRDVTTAIRLCDALVSMANQAGSSEGTTAAAALAAYGAGLRALTPATEFEVVGRTHYTWRFRHAALLPWTPDELLKEAQTALANVDAELTALAPKLAARPSPSPAQLDAARALTRDGLLGLYDAVEVSLRAATLKGNWVSIPDGVGPIRARETPDALVPLTGDGGSMNPPPTYGASNVAYWNVEHFHREWSDAERATKVMIAQGFASNRLGTYAAHEGYPGHHLQLAIARMNADPLRSIVPDPVQNEGWALYAEEALWEHGGLGPEPASREAMLRSYRFRIARVIYDVNIERGDWDLQRGADFKDKADAGKGVIDEDIMRAIQWPTQLVCYFAGKLQIVRLRDELKKRQGAKFDERAFHDALLAEGSVPITLIRAKMLGEPIPDPEGVP